MAVKWLGTLAYQEAYRFQCRLREARREGLISDTLLLLEHPPTFTIGRRDSSSDFLVPPEELIRRGFEVVKTQRGGRVTYHGPGQLVGYLIVDLARRRLSVPEFVGRVQGGLQSLLEEWGVEAVPRPGAPGLWVNGRKIASLGFHIDRGISIHGFALNIAMDLAPFQAILPCGSSCAITSVALEGGVVNPLDSLTFSCRLHMNAAFF